MNFDEILCGIDNPQVYTGKEINVIKKDFNSKSLNICLIFPDTYEIGMSHYGLKILYHYLNQMNGINAERCFLPTGNSINIFKEKNIPLFSLENRIPLKQFDLLSFSVLSELNFTNILQTLELAQFPLKSTDRVTGFPLVAAGGISVSNPEPLREFIDFFGIGDGEIIFPEIIETLRLAKINNLPRNKVLRRLDEIPGIYIPVLFSLRKKGRFFQPELKGKTIKKRVFKPIDRSFPDENIIVPISKAVFDRLSVEIARGCIQTCRFCQAKSFYSPFRTKSLAKSAEFIEKALRETGFEIFSLTSLSSGDYPRLKELLDCIPDIIPPCTSFSISSLRPATLSDQLLSTIARFRRTGITMVPEAGTQRLRNVINKSVSDQEILRGVKLALDNNWKQIKLYFMIGLPTESIEDVRAIPELIKNMLNLAREHRKKIRIHVSVSTFVPKPHTPLQWAKRENLEILNHKLDLIRQELKKYRQIHLDLHSPHRGEVETILSRGDSRVGDLLIKAYNEGEIFSAWDSAFHYPVWDRIIKGSGLEDFLSEIDPAEPLPWDFIQINYRKNHLLNEYRKSGSAITTPSCEDQKCMECKGCVYPQTDNPPRLKVHFTRKQAKTELNLEPIYNQVRIFYEKSGDFRFFSHLSLMKYIERLLRKSGLGFQCTQGFHPRVKISYPPPLPVCARGLDEVMELFLDEHLNEPVIINSLKQVAGDFKFRNALICNQKKPLIKDIHFIEYEFHTTKPISPEVREYCLESDEIISSRSGLNLKIDFSRQGQERFSRIYKILDPERKSTFHLTRKRFIFKND